MGDDAPLVYMAGPIQHASDYGVGWRERLQEDYPEVRWLNPIDKYHSAVEEVRWPALRVVHEDLRMIDRSDAMFVGWSEVPSCGTPMEVFYAAYVRDIPVGVWFHDVENVSPWMETFADYISDDEEKVIEFLMDRAGGEDVLRTVTDAA